jgi:hypothetical protein
MLSILSDATFSRTRCGGPIVAATGTQCILSVSLTTEMNPSTQSAQPCRPLYCVGITTASGSAWGRNIYWTVFSHLLDQVSTVFPPGRRSCNSGIRFCGVQLQYITGNEGTRPWKVAWRSLSVYCTQMLRDFDVIASLAFASCTSQSSPRGSTHVGQWRGWW